MKKIYIAGPYSADNITDCLENMRNGMRMGAKVLLAGYAPWVPWHDFHHHLMLRDSESLSIDDYYKFSIEWLKVSDYMLVLPGWENSKGTLAEIEIAEKHRIPVYHSLKKLIVHDLNI